MRKFISRFVKRSLTNSLQVNKLTPNLISNSLEVEGKNKNNQINLLKPGKLIEGKINFCIEKIGYVTDIKEYSVIGLLPLIEANYWSQLHGKSLKYGDIIQGYIGKVI